MKFFMFDEEMLKKLDGYAMVTGTSFIAIGCIGILTALFFRPSIDIALGILFLSSGIAALLSFYKNCSAANMVLLQPIILVVAGLVFLSYPVKNDTVILMTLIFYFFLDGFAKTAIAVSLKPLKKWRLLFYGGVVSIMLAIFILVGWPLTTLWILIILASANLLFDGSALLLFALSLKKELENSI
ncbi:HdeD family acid-resistance protein [Nitrosophilus alvini]|uniref:HdeD family acid-resistance protein n=1 Tax=Nitrosophilus alvini TaxID=2714855 RepID=UPI00190DFB8C|nr:DUF308 domain-containing protein [Nitrosophilus alvini]